MSKNNFFFTLFFWILFLATSSSAQIITPDSDNTDGEKLQGLSLNNVDSSRFYNRAVLQGLNKTTAKSYDFEVKIGESAEFGKLTVFARKCWQAPLDQKPDSRILLEIFETKPNGEKEKIFYGWMISSSPSISGLEHPIYDIIAISCKNK